MSRAGTGQRRVRLSPMTAVSARLSTGDMVAVVAYWGWSTP